MQNGCARINFHANLPGGCFAGILVTEKNLQALLESVFYRGTFMNYAGFKKAENSVRAEKMPVNGIGIPGKILKPGTVLKSYIFTSLHSKF